MSQSGLSVCVYCSSSEAVDASYREIAADLGRAIVAQGWRLVYGGGNVGLMGEVARAALEAGGYVTGVIPNRLADRELALDGVDELIRTDTMRERKALMDERSDAFIVLPGGIGTLEELLEIVTLKQLGFHNRAVVLLDARGYWDPLLEQFQRMVDQRMAAAAMLELWQTTTDVPGTIDAIATYTPPRIPVALPAEQVEAVEPPRGDEGVPEQAEAEQAATEQAEAEQAATEQAEADRKAS